MTKSIAVNCVSIMTIGAMFAISSVADAGPEQPEKADTTIQVTVQESASVPSNRDTTVKGQKSHESPSNRLPIRLNRVGSHRSTRSSHQSLKSHVDRSFINGSRITIDPTSGNGQSRNHRDYPHDWCSGVCKPSWACPTMQWYPTNGFCCSLTGGYFTNPDPIAVDRTVKVDVALADVRFCDAGDVVSKLGPRYRIMVRNKGRIDVRTFHVVMMAGMDKVPTPNAPASLVKVVGLQSGQTKVIDVRLPAKSLMIGMDQADVPVPFSTLFVAVDSHEELNDIDLSNNGTVMNRLEVPLVD